MSDKLNEKSIPTLDKLVVPGQADIRAKQTMNDDTRVSSEETKTNASETTDNDGPRSAFKATIEAIVTEILHRHMEQARLEIIRKIVDEVRSRLKHTSNVP
jgi:hypothetical protein